MNKGDLCDAPWGGCLIWKVGGAHPGQLPNLEGGGNPPVVTDFFLSIIFY